MTFGDGFGGPGKLIVVGQSPVASRDESARLLLRGPVGEAPDGRVEKVS